MASVWLVLFHDPWAHYGSEPEVIGVCLSADQAELAARRHVRSVATARSPGSFDGAAYVLHAWMWTGEFFECQDEERHLCLLRDGEDCPPRPPTKVTDVGAYIESGNPEDWKEGCKEVAAKQTFLKDKNGCFRSWEKA